VFGPLFYLYSLVLVKFKNGKNIVIICTNRHFVNFVKAKFSAGSLKIGGSGLNSNSRLNEFV